MHHRTFESRIHTTAARTLVTCNTKKTQKKKKRILRRKFPSRANSSERWTCSKRSVFLSFFFSQIWEGTTTYHSATWLEGGCSFLLFSSHIFIVHLLFSFSVLFFLFFMNCFFVLLSKAKGKGKATGCIWCSPFASFFFFLSLLFFLLIFLIFLWV